MTAPLADQLARLGLSAPAAAVAIRRAEQTETAFRRRAGDPGRARRWWVPGRIEVLGKHTDYGGGRSLLCAVERGFHVVAAPRADAVVQIIDASTGAPVSLRIDAELPARAGHWTDYPISVLRRVARDFPEARTGMDIAIRSSLPSASGLSSSSALVIAIFLPLAAFNRLDEAPRWREALPTPEALAGYLGAVENGRTFGTFGGDRGVGTLGGSEDHTAILCCRPGTVSQYRFLPVTAEAQVKLPAGWIFAIASSGAHAPKGGAVQEHYNALSRQLAAILERWNATGRHDVSLLDAMQREPAAFEELAASLERTGPPALAARLRQFATECGEIIPGVVDALRNADNDGVGALVDRSQQLAESVLGNQIAETVHLARTARRHGALAASAFGAGFGGSVWALVREDEAGEFLDLWRTEYRAAFPARRNRSEFFLSRPGPGATELDDRAGPGDRIAAPGRP